MITLILIYIHQILSKQTNMVTTTSRTNGDYWATTFINSDLTTQETLPYTDATTSYDYETNKVAKKDPKTICLRQLVKYV
jgi:hypothetical protein